MRYTIRHAWRGDCLIKILFILAFVLSRQICCEPVIAIIMSQVDSVKCRKTRKTADSMISERLLGISLEDVKIGFTSTREMTAVISVKSEAKIFCRYKVVILCAVVLILCGVYLNSVIVRVLHIFISKASRLSFCTYSMDITFTSLQNQINSYPGYTYKL